MWSCNRYCVGMPEAKEQASFKLVLLEIQEGGLMNLNTINIVFAVVQIVLFAIAIVGIRYSESKGTWLICLLINLIGDYALIRSLIG